MDYLVDKTLRNNAINQWIELLRKMMLAVIWMGHGSIIMKVFCVRNMQLFMTLSNW